MSDMYRVSPIYADIENLEEEFTNRDDVYIGRKKQIADVISAWKSVSIFGIYGLAGIGKSRFVRHVTRNLKEEFQVENDRSKFKLYTIDLRGAASLDDLKVKFTTSVGIEMKSRLYVQEMRERIMKSGDLFILVFENVEYIEDIAVLRSKFLEDCRELAMNNPRVRIFINSRVKYAILEPPFLPVELQSLTRDESAELLKMAAPSVDFGPRLEKIIELCGGHPMAMKIVG